MPETERADAWKQWFQENGTRLLLFARQQTRSADAEDVLQNALTRLWKSSDSKEPPALALAYTAIRHAAIDLGRKTTRRIAREQKSEYLVDKQTDSGDWFGTAALEEKERNAALQDALGKIPDKFREVLSLKLWGGLTFAEIADVLDLPLNTAASRYRYALEAIRKVLPKSQFQ